MKQSSRRHFLQLGGFIGVSVLSGCQAITSSQSSSNPDDDSENLGLGISKSHHSCLSDSNDVYSGWVHTVAHGETYDLTFDVRIAHSPSTEASVTLDEGVTGEYVLAFTTDGTVETDTPIDSDCVNGSRLKAGGSLPDDFETLRITVNGRTIQTLEQEGTVPTLRPLPDPIEA